MHLILSIQWKT